MMPNRGKEPTTVYKIKHKQACNRSGWYPHPRMRPTKGKRPASKKIKKRKKPALTKKTILTNTLPKTHLENPSSLNDGPLHVKDMKPIKNTSNTMMSAI